VIGQIFTVTHCAVRYYCRDEMVSMLQKAIRRGLVPRAIFAMKELYLCDDGLLPPTTIRTNLLNRLAAVVSEDIGIANPTLCVNVRRVLHLDDFRSNPPSLENIARVVQTLCQSSKCREVDEIIHVAMHTSEEHVARYDPGTGDAMPQRPFRPQKGDPDELVGFMNKFLVHLERGDALPAAYWAQKVFAMNGSCARRNTSKGKSTKGIYAVWQSLFRKNRSNYRDVDLRRDTISLKIMQTLKFFFDRRKNGRTERLPLVHAIMFACEGDLLRRDDPDFLPRLSGASKKLLREHVKVTVPDWVLDKHTRRGKSLGRGTAHFYDEGAVLVGKIRESPYAADARRMDLSREQNRETPAAGSYGKKRKQPLGGRRKNTRPLKRRKLQ